MDSERNVAVIIKLSYSLWLCALEVSFVSVRINFEFKRAARFEVFVCFRVQLPGSLLNSSKSADNRRDAAANYLPRREANPVEKDSRLSHHAGTRDTSLLNEVPVKKKTTTFVNPVFASHALESTVFSRDSEHNINNAVCLLQESCNFSRSVSQLDKLSQEQLLHYPSLSTSLSMSSLGPFFYSRDSDELPASKRSVSMLFGYDNQCFLADSFDDPFVLKSQLKNSEPSNTKDQTKNCADKTCLVLIGGFEEDYMPRKNAFLEIFISPLPSAGNYQHSTNASTDSTSETSL